MNAEQDPRWYEVSIGIEAKKTWFRVDELKASRIFDGPPQESRVEVATDGGRIVEIIVLAQFPHLPTLEDAMAVVLKDTHCDHLPEVQRHLITRRFVSTSERDRLRRCVPAEGAKLEPTVSGVVMSGDGR